MFYIQFYQMFAQKHEGKLHHHENVETIQLLDNAGIVRRLQREKTFELVLTFRHRASSILGQAFHYLIFA